MTYTYNNLNQLTNISEQETGAESTATKNTAFTYDANGNTLSKRTYGQSVEEVVQYTYNQLNQLTEFEDAEGNVTAYAYDGTGMRVSKTQGTNVQRFYWDRGYVVNESTNGTFTASNRVGIQGIFARTTGSGENTQTDFLFKNAHGDVTDIVSDDEVTNEYDYDAYGNQKNTSANDTNPFRYCGEYYDDESGLIYLRNRYYDPEIGRFITEDPIHDGLNWYAYCGNNPVVFVDLIGLIKSEDKYLDESIQMILNGKNKDGLGGLSLAWEQAETQEEKAYIANLADRVRMFNTSNIDRHMILLNSNGASGLGHTATLLINSENQAILFSYYSKNGSAIGPGETRITYLNDYEWTGLLYKNFLQNLVTNNGDIKQEQYTNNLYLSVNNSQGKKALKEIANAFVNPGEYNLATNNCDHKTAKILNSTGLYYDKKVAPNDSFANTYLLYTNTRAWNIKQVFGQ